MQYVTYLHKVFYTLFEASPKPFYEYIVSCSSFTVHADLNVVAFQ